MLEKKLTLTLLFSDFCNVFFNGKSYLLLDFGPLEAD
jgi:hypothetical protein